MVTIQLAAYQYDINFKPTKYHDAKVDASSRLPLELMSSGIQSIPSAYNILRVVLLSVSNSDIELATRRHLLHTSVVSLIRYLTISSIFLSV